MQSGFGERPTQKLRHVGRRNDEQRQFVVVAAGEAINTHAAAWLA